MGFAWTRSESRPWIAIAGTAEASTADADRAAAVLRADYERWSRWGLGLLGFALAVVGAFFAAGMTGSLSADEGPVSSLDIVVAVSAVIATALGTVVLIALWLSGHRTLVAAAWWLRLPHLESGRQRRAPGWLEARTVNFEPRIFVRLVSGALAILLAIAGVSLYLRDVINAEVGALSVAALMIGVIALLSALGQLGGVIRLVRGLSEADPLWARIRTSLHRS